MRSADGEPGIVGVGAGPRACPRFLFPRATGQEGAGACPYEFGGIDDTGRLNDIWEWDGTTWTDRTPSGTKPSPRHTAMIAYDANSSTCRGSAIDGAYHRSAIGPYGNGAPGGREIR